jgi:hypothetical protein
MNADNKPPRTHGCGYTNPHEHTGVGTQTQTNTRVWVQDQVLSRLYIVYYFNNKL